MRDENALRRVSLQCLTLAPERLSAMTMRGQVLFNQTRETLHSMRPDRSDADTAEVMAEYYECAPALLVDIRMAANALLPAPRGR